MRAIIAGVCPGDVRERVEMEADMEGISNCPELLFRLLAEMNAVQDIREEEQWALHERGDGHGRGDGQDGHSGGGGLAGGHYGGGMGYGGWKGSLRDSQHLPAPLVYHLGRLPRSLHSNVYLEHFQYKIVHINSEDNLWGNLFSRRVTAPTCSAAPTVSVCAVQLLDEEQADMPSQEGTEEAGFVGGRKAEFAEV